MDGSLSGLLKDLRKAKKKLDWVEALLFIKQIINGYKVLYDNEKVHRDLKSDNIFYNKLKNGDYEFKIADFGLTKVLKKKNNTVNNGTITHRAPEQRPTGDGLMSNKIDVFPIGVMLFEFLIGSDPI